MVALSEPYTHVGIPKSGVDDKKGIVRKSSTNESLNKVVPEIFANYTHMKMI